MIDSINNTLHGVLELTWPIIVISSVIIVTFRLCFLVKNKQKLILYKELFMFSFIIYALCLFQIVTFQDDVSWASNNFIPFREILRYNMGSRLFMKNVIGNMVLFLPYGFFTSFYLKLEKPYLTVLLTLITSTAIELVQLSIGRVFDIDDIILNVLGGCLGYLLYKVIKKVWDKLPGIFKTDIVLDLVAIIILIFIVMLI